MLSIDSCGAPRFLIVVGYQKPVIALQPARAFGEEIEVLVEPHPGILHRAGFNAIAIEIDDQRITVRIAGGCGPFERLGKAISRITNAPILWI